VTRILPFIRHSLSREESSPFAGATIEHLLMALAIWPWPRMKEEFGNAKLTERGSRAGGEVMVREIDAWLRQSRHVGFFAIVGALMGGT
jgi:hypothetical protein